MNAALGQLRAEGYPVRDEDLARLSPFVRRQLGVYLDTLQNRYGPGPAVS